MSAVAQERVAEWIEDQTKPEGIDAILTERGSRYGIFTQHAKITQDLKRVMRSTPGWERLSDSQMEALEMIQHKIGRALNGDPNYDDHWADIAGYSQLVFKELNGTLV
jgi:hypothetical protein